MAEFRVTPGDLLIAFRDLLGVLDAAGISTKGVASIDYLREVLPPAAAEMTQRYADFAAQKDAATEATRG